MITATDLTMGWGDLNLLDKGLLQSVQRASNAFGDTARTVDGLGSELQDTMASVRQAAKSIHKLADALEKEPDMLMKGRLAEKQQ